MNQRRDQDKKQRITAWKQKMIFGTSSKNVSKYVYQWINSKSRPKLQNLICNDQGMIIFDPYEALNEINHKWDDIFAVNILHEDPEKILH